MEILPDILKNVGLDEYEAKSYLTLVNNGAMSILDLSNKSGLKRTNLYNVLQSLEEKGLVRKLTDKKATKYFPNSPREVYNLIELKENQLSSTKNTFDLLINNLQSQYNLISHKPTITYFEGLKGLQKLYEDILDTGKDICIVRSIFDDKRKDVDRIIQKQIAEQVKRGIKAKVIGPPEPESKNIYLNYDKLRLTEERFITRVPFSVSAQIIIYGNKTAIATIKNDIIITLIDNVDTTSTFRVLFDFIWEYSKVEHEKLVKDWK